MIIGIPLSENAYTPEALAYEEYLKQRGHKVQLDYELDPDNDVNLHFMGVMPFWHRKRGRSIDIHEYQSLSTPPYPSIKNRIKKILNKKPSGRIFLNQAVHHELNFDDDIPYIYRDMGVESSLFQTPSKNPIYDIVYCGSISNRPGLVQTILKLSNDFKIVVVGSLNESDREILDRNNITLLGRVDRSHLPSIYNEAHFGLNYTPDIYPYNIQTSTKTLEYMASGLDVISNRYLWAERFFVKIGYHPYWLEEDIFSAIENNPSRLKAAHISLIENFSWEHILNNCNLDAFLRDLVSHEVN